MASTSVPLLLVLAGLALDFAAGQLCRNNFTSFVFERFDCFTDRHLKCTGDCTCTAEGQVNLTSYDTKSWGRLMYSPGIRLMDPVSSRVASFSTNFTFSMKGEYSRPGEGLAFVMQGNPEFQGHGGGFLGLYNSNGKAGTPTVAVEFDTYRDWFYGFFRYNDINNNHVGVDIDSINSKLQVDAGVFGIELAKERTVTAWIDYIPATEDSDGNLQVRISTDTTRPHLAILSYDVDLSKHISEMMYMGFSATTGDRCVSYHNILNWSFESWGLVPLSPPPILPPPPSVLPPIPLPPEPPAPSPCPVPPPPPPPPPSPAPSPLTPSPSPSEFSPPAPAPSSSASPPSESPTAVPPPPSLSPPAPSPVIPPVPAPSPLPDSTAPVPPPPAPIPPIPDVPAPSPSLSPPPAISPSSSPASEPSLAPQSTPTPSAGPSPSSSVSPPAPASSPTPSAAPSPSSYVSPPAPTPTPSPAPSPSSYVSPPAPLPPAPSSTPATSPSSYVPPPSPDSPSLPPAPDSHSTPVPSPGQSPSSASPPEDSPPSKLPPTYPPADPPSSSGPPTLTPGPSPSLTPSPEPALPPSPTPAPPPTPLPGQADATRPMSASIAGFALLLAAYVIVVWNKVQSELRDARHGHGEDGFFVGKP